MNKPKNVKIAVIGCGARANVLIKNLLQESNGQIEIVALYDPDKSMMQEKALLWHSEQALQCSSCQEAINAPAVEWVMVCSPNAAHKKQILAAFAAGKHVFSEKPLATTITDCQAIDEAQRLSSKMFATGFVLRYAPLYEKLKSLLDSGEFGKIIAIEGSENIRPEHGGLIMAGWRRHKSVAGPHLLEKCCHDLDLINWFTQSLPVKVATFGGRDFFTPENAYLEQKYGESTFRKWSQYDTHTIGSPFTADSDLMDNTVSILEFANRIKATFFVTMSNAIHERRLFFSCSEGTIKCDLYTGKIVYQKLADAGYTTIDIPGDGHGGGDIVIARALADSMLHGTFPKCGGLEGLQSAIVALALDEAAKNGEVINLRPIWEKLNIDLNGV